jgi:hypothetical protein
MDYATRLILGSCYHDRKLDRRIFREQAIYGDEMEKIFGRAC